MSGGTVTVGIGEASSSGSMLGIGVSVGSGEASPPGSMLGAGVADGIGDACSSGSMLCGGVGDGTGEVEPHEPSKRTKSMSIRRMFFPPFSIDLAIRQFRLH